MVANALSVVKGAEKVLENDKDWFLREYHDAKNMPNEAKRIVEDLHKHALNPSDIVQFRLLVLQLHQLARDERWQQWRIGFDKLRSVMANLLKLPFFNDLSRRKQKEELTELTRDEGIWKASLLADTALKLKPLVEGKRLEQITAKNWDEIAKLTKRVVTDLDALIATITRMEKIIEETTGVKI